MDSCLPSNKINAAILRCDTIVNGKQHYTRNSAIIFYFRDFRVMMCQTYTRKLTSWKWKLKFSPRKHIYRINSTFTWPLNYQKWINRISPDSFTSFNSVRRPKLLTNSSKRDFGVKQRSKISPCGANHFHRSDSRKNFVPKTFPQYQPLVPPDGSSSGIFGLSAAENRHEPMQTLPDREPLKQWILFISAIRIRFSVHSAI